MIETILEILKQSDADDYKIISSKTVSNEFFFVQHKLDMNRKKEVEHIQLTVYKKIDHDSYLGSSSCEIHPTMSREEVENAIKNLCISASYVKNPIYTLNGSNHKEMAERKAVDAKKAAQDALNGWDPSYGSIYYFNPSTATNKWIWSRPHVVTIGKHRFCK